jgi:hypothetical protein
MGATAKDAGQVDEIRQMIETLFVRPPGADHTRKQQ